MILRFCIGGGAPVCPAGRRGEEGGRGGTGGGLDEALLSAMSFLSFVIKNTLYRIYTVMVNNAVTL